MEEFHGAAMMEYPGTRSMNLTDNLCHEYAVQVARMAPPDFVVNVTIRDDGRPVGVFAGDIDTVLAGAFEQLKSFVLLPLPQRFDIVVTHGGRGPSITPGGQGGSYRSARGHAGRLRLNRSRHHRSGPHR